MGKRCLGRDTVPCTEDDDAAGVLLVSRADGCLSDGFGGFGWADG